MDAKDAIRKAAAASHMVLAKYTDDLSDQDLMLRPATGCNHLAWQLGHVISSEAQLLEMVCPGAAAELPAGFAEKHHPEATACDDATQFCTREEYFALWDKVRQATLAALDKLPEADFEKPGPEKFRAVFPTVGDVFLLIANHPMMHAGQFVPVRRALGKPVVI